MNFRHFKDIDININTFTTNIMTILLIVSKNSEMTEFIHDHIFNIDNYDKLQQYTKNIQYDEIFIKLHNDNDDECDNIEYPDNFYDPITCTKIKEPCLIPGMTGFDDLYFDRSTILKQLLVKNENPYTRAPLTQEEFESYNNLEDIQIKNKLFKEKMSNYK